MNLYEKILKKAIEKPYPLHCLFEVTYRCNLQCTHCYIKRDKKKREMDFNTICDILDQLKDAGCLYLTFSGGEIFTREDFFKIASYARKLNFALRLFTNGTMIDENTAKLIKEIRPLSIEITILGFKDVYEKMTRDKDSFNKLLKSIFILKENNLNVILKTPILKENVASIWRLNQFIEEELKLKSMIVGSNLLITPCDDGDRSPLKHRLNNVQLKRYIAEEFRQRDIRKIPFRPVERNYNDILCGAGILACNITPYGDLNPCVQIRIKKNNSLRKISFDKIWRENIYFKQLRELRLKDRIKCIKCKLLSYCDYCAGVVYLEKGSFIDVYHEFCRIASVRYHLYKKFNQNKKY